MARRAQDRVEDLLEECIGQLFRGEDWEARIPADHPCRIELIELMAVAGRLFRARSSGWSISRVALQRGQSLVGLLQRSLEP